MNRKSVIVFLCALGLVAIGSSLANFVNTAGGKVAVSDLRFTDSNGAQLSALLYRPKTASAENPVPGVLAIHGYINSRETQSGFAIELARRGFVVLAMDQRGHGYSDPPTFAGAFGAPAGLNYLHSLDFVDKQRIGLEGHSMGGWASRAATQLMPEHYQSIVMVGSSTTPLAFGNFTGSATEPKNIAIVYSLYDEFSEFMWEGSLPQDLASAPKLQALFGTDSTVEVDKLYGSVEQGTARRFYQPATTHPGDHISPEAVLNSVEWLQLTLNQASNISPESHIFLWKEVGTLIALVGIILCIFPLCQLLLASPLFSSLAKPLIPANDNGGWSWWVAALISTALPAATFFSFYNWTAATVSASSLWPQNITTAIAGWALLNGLITLVMLTGQFATSKQKGLLVQSTGLTLSPGNIIRTLALASLVVGLLVIIAYLVETIFISDFRFWVVALKPMSAAHWGIFFAYLPIFAVFFLTLSASLAGPLRRKESLGLAAHLCLNLAICSIGFIVLLVIQYASLFATGTLLIAEPLLTIVAIQFVPLLIVISCIATFCLRLTGSIYLGAFINALFVTWYIVAGQATHVA